MRGPVAISLALALTVVAVDCLAGSGRFYGSINASYSTTSSDNFVTATDSTDTSRLTTTTTKYGQSQLLLNYEDLLFFKNALRLATNIAGRQITDAGKWEFRPTYYYDLKSYGYLYTGSYTPYSQTFSVQIPSGQTFTTKLRYREWRNALTLSYAKFPAVIVTYNLGHTYDDLPTRLQDSRSRNVVVESGYTLGDLAVRGNVTQTRNINKVTKPETSNTFHTLNGTLSYARDLKKAGYVSSTYSLLDTKLENKSTQTSVPVRSKVHSIAGFYNTRSFKGLSASASYSGRFTRSHTSSIQANTSDEDFTGQMGYAPTKFLAFDVTENYQIGGKPDGNHISAYLTISSTVNRFLRRGVDSRFSWSRTFFQRVEAAEDSLASSSGTSADNFYASLSAQPYPHTRLLTNVSVSRTNDGKANDKRYNVTRSMNLVLSASRKLEARTGASYTFQGKNLSLTRSYSSNVNAGITYYPGSSINMNLTYIRTSVNSTPRLTNSTLAAYFGYSFRQVLNTYVSFNRQSREVPDQDPAAIGGKSTVEPRGMSAQMQYRLSPQSSISLNYTHNTGAATTGAERKTDIVQVIFNGQF